eukprot:scaffold180846_cov31-Prasinocladus_malaysianus.AAC.2
MSYPPTSSKLAGCLLADLSLPYWLLWAARRLKGLSGVQPEDKTVILKHLYVLAKLHTCDDEHVMLLLLCHRPKQSRSEKIYSRKGNHDA